MMALISFLSLTKTSTMRMLTVATVIAALLSVTASHNASDISTRLACLPTFFACKNAYSCVGNQYMCDGKDNCGDNSDEDLTACILHGKVQAQLTCGWNDFRCKNGLKCVPTSYLCDNDNNCGDNSDEDPEECIRAGLYDDNVTCSDIGFLCGGGMGRCISRKLLCNGQNDCGDNTDENVTNCRAEGVVKDVLNCRDFQFRCKNEFKCIPKVFLCDHVNDCFDGSDEDAVECAKAGLVPEGTACADLGFECTNTTFGGSFCIGNLFICDGKDNCGDNSEENQKICGQRANKPKIQILPWYEPPEPKQNVMRLCGNDRFMCESACLSKARSCHPNLDCDGRSGEDRVACLNHTRSLKCASHEFKCKSSKCVYMGYICDGDDDCGDRSDEDPIMCNSTVHTTTTTRNNSQSIPSPKRPLICRRDDFKCLNGNRCIRSTSVCDRKLDCADGSDETDETCTKKASCADGQFQCNNRKCIPSSYVCDGDNDCEDNTDESAPYCSSSSSSLGISDTSIPPVGVSCWDGKFQCSTGSLEPTCIVRFQVCDGIRNCPLGDDEHDDICHESSAPERTTTTTFIHSTVVSCAAGEFMCTDHHKCIPISLVCDEAHDCGNGSDEDPSICPSSSLLRPVERNLGESTDESLDKGHDHQV